MTTSGRIPVHQRPIAIVEVDGGYLRTGRSTPVEVAVSHPGQPGLAWLVRLGDDPSMRDVSSAGAGADQTLKGHGLPCRVVALELQDALKGCQILSGDPLRTRRFFKQLYSEAGLRGSVKVTDLFGHLRCMHPSQTSIDEANTVANDRLPLTERAAAEADRNAIFLTELIARAAAHGTRSQPASI